MLFHKEKLKPNTAGFSPKTHRVVMGGAGAYPLNRITHVFSS